MKRKDLTGYKFGRLTVVEYSYSKRYKKSTVVYWKCKCDCGNECIVAASKLRSGHTKSCGCYSRELASKNVQKNRHKKKKNTNEYYIYGDIVFVKFSNCEEYFLCDLDDWDKLKEHYWRKSSHGYAVSSGKKDGGIIYMHRLVTNCPDGLEPDHIYPVALGVCDNRKSNLEVKTHQENMFNQRLRKNNTSGYTGVVLDGRSGKWSARLIIDGKNLFLGNYDNIEDAIEARKKGELKYYGRCYN